ncbi:aTPase component of ABC transporters with duplicated ATPase domain [Pseudoloma neurophilia]|uniref:ATPase component of ABC transporters with duplicated ATPase domain n=1 Tax=Pseudoloma neurophilia TaxID=146866 RepID=A0A0R0M5G7_9MICR|nr:aTPase component of ABC transporters with duplicated ATPase domain [Pseudoloma neurophilia]
MDKDYNFDLRDRLLIEYQSKLTDYPFLSQSEHDLILNDKINILPDQIVQLDRIVTVSQFNKPVETMYNNKTMYSNEYNNEYNKTMYNDKTYNNEYNKTYNNDKTYNDYERTVVENIRDKKNKKSLSKNNKKIPNYFYRRSTILPNIPDMTISHSGHLLLELDGLNLNTNSIYGLIGKNGIGKSSFFKEISKIAGVYLMNQEEQTFCKGKCYKKLKISEYLRIFFEESEIFYLIKWFELEDLNLKVCECFDSMSSLMSNTSMSSLVSNTSVSKDSVSGAFPQNYPQNSSIRESVSNTTSMSNASISSLMSNTTSMSNTSVNTTSMSNNSVNTTSINTSSLRQKKLDQIDQSNIFYLNGIYSTIAQSPLSGGQKRKLHLIISFLIDPQLLLLDEPTNMLDLLGIERLINLIRLKNITIIIISHDIYFLNNLTNFILEIENKKIGIFKGNFSNYQKQKEEKIKLSQKQKEESEKKMEHFQYLKAKYGVRKSKMVQSREKQIMKTVDINCNTNTISSLYGDSLIREIRLEGGKTGTVIKIEEMGLFIQDGKTIPYYREYYSSNDSCSNGSCSNDSCSNDSCKYSGISKYSDSKDDGISKYSGVSKCNASKDDGVSKCNDSKDDGISKYSGVSKCNASKDDGVSKCNDSNGVSKNSSKNDNGVSKKEKHILKGVNFTLSGNQKVLLIGPNGIGKSTFLNCIRDQYLNHSLKSLDFIRFKENLKILWIGQDHSDNFDMEDRVIPFLYKKYLQFDNPSFSHTNTSFSHANASFSHANGRNTLNDTISRRNEMVFDESMADKVLIQKIRLNLSIFSLNKDYHKIGTLSGGEKTKLLLTLLLLIKPDVLLLDEITNNLDIETIRQVKTIIEYYNGAVIAISHDRWFSEIFKEVYEINNQTMVYHGEKI